MLLYGQLSVVWTLAGAPPAAMTINQTTGAVQWLGTAPIASSGDPYGTQPVLLSIVASNPFGTVRFDAPRSHHIAAQNNRH